MTLSIIIPLYNCKRFIGKCIKSCLNQGLENDDYEIIVVNDASTDGGENKVVSLSESFSNIHLINHKVNLGPEQSRLTGFLSSNGRFVFFIDGDDWLEPKVLSYFIEYAENKECDLVCGRRAICATFGNLKLLSKTYEHVEYGEINQPILFDKYWVSFFGKSLIPIFLTGNLIRRECISSEFFKTGMRFWEDQYELLRIFVNINKAFYSPKKSYNYRMGGMTSLFNSQVYNDHKTLFRLRLKAIEDYHYEKARYYACGEMKNVFKQFVCEMILQKSISEVDIKHYIRQELSDNIWDDVFLLEYAPLFKNLAYTSAMMNKDVDAIYNICLKEAKSGRVKRVIHRIWNSLYSVR